jgi:hypothetical protein
MIHEMQAGLGLAAVQSLSHKSRKTGFPVYASLLMISNNDGLVPFDRVKRCLIKKGIKEMTEEFRCGE